MKGCSLKQDNIKEDRSHSGHSSCCGGRWMTYIWAGLIVLFLTLWYLGYL